MKVIKSDFNPLNIPKKGIMRIVKDSKKEVKKEVKKDQWWRNL